MKNPILLLFVGVRVKAAFNETCSWLNQEQKCSGECNADYQTCMGSCDPSDYKCTQYCNRDLTTCIDRCPCHDKCSWGCPCGFYQCSPPSTCDIQEENSEAFDECGIYCISEADRVTGECIAANQNTEDECYAKGNEHGWRCMEDCPCGENCKGGCKECPNNQFCGDNGGISNQDMCMYVWGANEAACKGDVQAEREVCMGACNDALCEDDCNEKYTEKLKLCPCHTVCPNGCACTPSNTFGNSYCPTLPLPDENCLGDHGDVSQDCRDSCGYDAYICVSKCYGDGECLAKCQDQEAVCVNKCPCYPGCPSGCPCFDWCQSTPPPIEIQCEAIWGDEASRCETDQKNTLTVCNANCLNDSFPSICQDNCAEQYSQNLKKCPCHKQCANGCNCPTENELGNSYCPDGLPDPDLECLEQHGESSQICRDSCTTSGYICVNTCAGDSQCEVFCREKVIECINGCPCYPGCDFPETPECLPSLEDQCKVIWGEEAASCEQDQLAKLNSCLAGCSTGTCQDQCNQQYVNDSSKCPCHTHCPNGCRCPPDNVLGNSYCPNLPDANADCLEDYSDISAQCRDSCTSDAYYCSIACAPGDSQCQSDCRFYENVCVSNCPCYPECPLGCPCPGWCGGISDKDKCLAIWGDEARACEQDCADKRAECLSSCTTGTCEDKCNDEYIEECATYCPCHTYCSLGCACPEWNDLGNSYCPEGVPKPDPECLEDPYHNNLWQQCRSGCADTAYYCSLTCYGNPTCLSICRADEYACMNTCPCHEECPNGCPCPGWCGDIENPSIIEKCLVVWGDEAQACVDDCVSIRNECISGCNGSSLCEDACNSDYLYQCSYHCPCHSYCPNGCPCYNDIGNQYCPGPSPPANCIEEHGENEKICRDLCTDKSYDCMKACGFDEPACVSQCQAEMQECTALCPCHEQCPNGCPCPIYCPEPPPSTEDPNVSTPTTPPITAPPGGEIEPIYGDHVLVLSRDAATMFKWRNGEALSYTELTKGFTDTNARFDINGFWTHDACSVVVKGQSYIIGGAYDCTTQPEFCGHLNVQRAVMKLSETSCGLDIVMDGITKKLPYSMKEHSCTGFQKRLSGQADQERAIMCSPTDSADEINDGMDYQDRACWSSSDMVVWEREPWLRYTHIKATMKYHKGYVVIMGGTGLSNDGNILAYNDHPYVEFLSQNGQYNTTDGTFGTWIQGVSLPITLEEMTSVTDGEHLYVFGGLHYASQECSFWVDAATCNSRKVYRNSDPTRGFQWQSYGSLMNPRSRFSSILVGFQNQVPNLFHVAGYAKAGTDHLGNNISVTGRTIEKWWQTGTEFEAVEEMIAPDFSQVSQQTSASFLYDFISPQTFVINADWYNRYCL